MQHFLFSKGRKKVNKMRVQKYFYYHINNFELAVFLPKTINNLWLFWHVSWHMYKNLYEYRIVKEKKTVSELGDR